MNILQAKTYKLQILIIEQSQVIEQANFTYSPIKKLQKNKRKQLKMQLQNKQEGLKIGFKNKSQYPSKIKINQ